MKAAVYLRVSKDSTGEGLAVDRQRFDALETAKRYGWEVTRVEIDNDTSAAGKRQRPGFETLLTAIETGEVQAVISWDMTRLTRNRRDTVRVIETGQRHKTVLAFCRGSDLDLSTPSGRVMADILAAIARQEIEQKADRQRRANLQAAEQGRRVGGRRPFGYEPDGITIRQDEAEAVRRAFNDVLAGVPLARIAADWNERGLRTPQKKRNGQDSTWTAQTVRPVLMNPRYAGFRGYGPQPEHGRRKIEAVAPAQWPGIVSEERWRAVVGALSDPARYTSLGRGGRALLTGLARCGICGATVNVGGSRSGKARLYRCSASWGHISRMAAPVDGWISEVAIARLSRPDAVELLRDDHRPDIEELRTEATALRARLDQLATSFADGDLTVSQLRTATGRLRSKIAAVEAKMADAGRADVLGPLVSAPDIRATWELLGTDRQRAVIDTLMTVRLMSPGRGARTFNPETVTIDWRQA